MIVSTFQSEGYPALLMEETSETLKKCLLTNTGQCIPLNALAAGFIHTVRKHHLNPADTVLWLNRSDIACNIRLYPYHIQQILKQEGKGFENSGIYLGELSLFDISFKASTNAYFAYMFGGLLRSIGCKIRPYEVNPGETDQVMGKRLPSSIRHLLMAGPRNRHWPVPFRCLNGSRPVIQAHGPKWRFSETCMFGTMMS